MGGDRYGTDGAGAVSERRGVTSGGDPGTKVCPRCGARLFADMDVCYACLFDFSKDVPHDSAGEPSELDDSGEVPSDYDDLLRQEQLTDEEGRRTTRTARPAAPPQPVVPPRTTAPPPPAVPTRPSPPVQVSAAARAASSEPVVHPSPAPARMRAARTLGAEVGNDADKTLVLPEMRGGTWPIGILFRTRFIDFVHEVPAAGLAVGRAPDNDVVLHDSVVSRRHVRVYPAEGGLMVEDQGATNPAVFKGALLRGSARLGLGESLDIHGVQLVAVRLDRSS